ncbi:hydroxyisourate hydrolase [Roseateles terrae]|uniref:5-hydroxyisourate hydrolase n=1 Tax=Roseateles terrae TaxID=431060 RepID=A0ABR6GNL4_9BURK|nr:hydroxyisourate hydrolase [Roseateles terrae]MBB3193306.1 5-hydroxyisourate hydrolase [Roseateles terrae]OWQ89489.1 hydroxyisourate hydrolase [Roseateles terrae]
MRLSFVVSTLLAAGLIGASLPALAQDTGGAQTQPQTPTQAPAQNPLSVHVLDLQTGQPSPGIHVDLERRGERGEWLPLGSGVTDAQGRIRALVPAAALSQWVAGDYRVIFRTGEFYARQRLSSFFPEIPVVFHVESAQQHYHVPLLLSQYGFSTYRGN